MTDPDEPQLLTAMQQLARAARAAARPLARAPAAQRTAAIAAIAAALRAEAKAVLAANAADCAAARAAGAPPVLLERLALTPQRLHALHAALEAIAAQPDPVGALSAPSTLANGLRVQRMRLPLGVVLMIYEARPNVTLDAAALCLRSGNAVLLRGGTEAARTNAALAELTDAALAAHGLAGAVQRVPTQARAAVDLLLREATCIDLVIPRGGQALIEHVVAHSRIPVLRHDRGICHMYVAASAEPEMAARLVENAKVQRPGVCNALETLLVDVAVAARALPAIAGQLAPHAVALRGCPRTCALLPAATPASDADWDTEFLGLTLAVRVVDGLDAAIAHIDRHGTQHTAAIVCADPDAAARFCRDVEASCVLVNASTRFNDGGELGLGAEMGISTTRLHAYGPMGATALTVEKFVVYGEGHVRGDG